MGCVVRNSSAAFPLGGQKGIYLSSSPAGPTISLGMILMAIREAVPDPEAPVRIAQVLQRTAQEAAGDDPMAGARR